MIGRSLWSLKIGHHIFDYNVSKAAIEARILYDSRREAFFQTTKANAFPFCALLLLLRRFSSTERPKTNAAAAQEAVQSCTERDYRKKWKSHHRRAELVPQEKGHNRAFRHRFEKKTLLCNNHARARAISSMPSLIIFCFGKKVLNYRDCYYTRRDQ